MSKVFPENYYVEKLIKKLSKFGSLFNYEVLGEVSVKDRTIPIYGLQLGQTDPSVPVLGIFAGVHGLEKIGTHIIVNYLNTLASNLNWDTSLTSSLEKIKIVTIPIVNPGGMYLRKRSNPNGVDLMRNAPVDAESGGVFLGSGHRISKRLPWYRGEQGVLEYENQVLRDFVIKNMMPSPFAMSVDIHSGFGWHDRLWYPYAKSYLPFDQTRITSVFARYLKLSHPYHRYIVEKQSDSYLIHGDMWDHIYDIHKSLYGSSQDSQSLALHSQMNLEHKQLMSNVFDSRFSAPEDHKKIFIPWTLEVGSWSWLLRKPHRIFSTSGLFHTEKTTNKYAFTMRKHWGLLDFFQRMTIHYRTWVREQEPKKGLDSAVGF
ncbi:MAG: hypothetical protein M9899_08295 [Bdellovibrionaceae bacterium]|nr:hypothetical protein [Pseudobdellovibrionaceae bacterium]